MPVILIWARLLATIWRGVRDDDAFRALALAAVGLLAVGTVFYLIVEDWSLVDCFYFSAMTLATVGFGDFVPTTTVSKLFTVGYVLSGVGVLAAFVREIAVRRGTLLHRADARTGLNRSDQRP